METPERQKILSLAQSQLGKPYIFGIEVKLDDPDPKAFDCSEFVEWCYHGAGVKIPDGSKAQFEAMAPAEDPKPGDLGFFGDAERGIYHVGILFDDTRVIEARGEPYGKVIFRPVIAWREYKNFKGWRTLI